MSVGCEGMRVSGARRGSELSHSSEVPVACEAQDERPARAKAAHTLTAILKRLVDGDGCALCRAAERVP